MTARMHKGFIAVAVVVVAMCALALPAAAQIRVEHRTAGHDLFYFHGRLGAGPGPEVSAYGVAVDVANDAGPVFHVALAPHACVDRGRYCRYDSAAAQTARLGIAHFKMDYSTGRIWMTSYGDLSGATTAKMTVSLTIGGPTWGTYSVTAVFTKTRDGWRLPDSDPQW